MTRKRRKRYRRLKKLALSSVGRSDLSLRTGLFKLVLPIGPIEPPTGVGYQLIGSTFTIQ